MANKRTKKRYSPNMFDGGGFQNFINSDTFQNISKGMKAFNFSDGDSGSFLSMNQGGGGGRGLLGAIGSAVDTTGQMSLTIDKLLTKPRKPLARTIGLYAKGGRLYAAGGGIGAEGFMNMGTTAMALTGNAIQNAQIADTSDIQEQIRITGTQPVAANTNDELMNAWSNRTELSHVSRKDLRNKSLFGDFANSLSASGQGFSAGSAAGPWGAAIGGIVGGVSSVVGSIIGRKKARKKAKKLNTMIDEANERSLSALEDRTSAVERQSDLNMLANYSAYGGPLDFGGGAIDYELYNEDLQNQKMSAMAKLKLTSLPNSFQALPELNTHNAFAEGGGLSKGMFQQEPEQTVQAANIAKDGGGIHIKKKNRGKFTEYCGGKVTEACIRKGKNSSNPTTRKRATFAQNARNWNAFGGWLNTQGGDFTNGVTFIDEGGSHEENPNQGIQMGIDPQGIPNLVEQGEVVYDDYVFSDRMEIPDDIRKEYKLRGKTFAKAAKSAQRESEERPNDPLSNRGLQAAMERIATAQEEARQRKEAHREGNEYPSMFAYGGDTDPTYGLALQDPMSAEELEALMAQYNEVPETAPEGNNDKRQTWTRYAPIIGSGLASLSDLFSRPDYSGANMVSGVDLGAEAAGYAPIGNYLSYRPLDRDFYINKMNQQAAATRRGLMNTSGGNRLNAQAGILAADYNYGQNMGNLARQAEEYNQQLRERVEAFNRGTNMFNTETGLKASMFNAESRNAAKIARLRQATTAAQMRQAIKDQDSARRSANITNFLQGLGDMGWENEQANWLDTLAKSGVLKMNTKGEYTGGTKKAKGGKVRTKKKKGLTYG